MKKRIILMPVLVLLILLILGMNVLADGKEATLEAGQDMPEFSMPVTDGSTVTLSGLLEENDLVVINLFASWCHYCKEEFPDLEAVYEKNSDRMELVAVSVYPKDTMDLMAEYKETYGLSFPVGLANGELDCVDHSSIPVTIFIDKYGKVGKIQVGQMTQEGFEEYVDYFLSPDYDGTPIETPKQLDISLLIYLSLAWFPISFILRVIGRWGIFRKSGKKGWFSLIPFFSVYQEYSLAWMGWIGIIVSLFMLLPVFNVWLNVNVYYLYALCAVAFVVTVPESILLAKSFGKKPVIGALLAVPVVHEIGRIVLGFGKAEYLRSDRK